MTTEISEKALSVAVDIDRRIAHEPDPENRAAIIAGYLIAFAALARAAEIARGEAHADCDVAEQIAASNLSYDEDQQ